MSLFDMREPIDTICRAFERIADRVERGAVERLSFGTRAGIRRIRVRFLTPTELKGASRPCFHVLLARIRDRVSTLRAMYQGGPIEVDFKALKERAALVQMTRCEIEHVEAERTSRRTGQTHSLGGFVGIAEYEGDLGEFVPYLEAAGWTGVGRQTVWGKGQIACEII